MTKRPWRYRKNNLEAMKFRANYPLVNLFLLAAKSPFSIGTTSTQSGSIFQPVMLVYRSVPSLKINGLHLKMDDWKTILSFRDGSISRGYVSFRERRIKVVGDPILLVGCKTCMFQQLIIRVLLGTPNVLKGFLEDSLTFPPV